jgi:hypothetical protein
VHPLCYKRYCQAQPLLQLFLYLMKKVAYQALLSQGELNIL